MAVFAVSYWIAQWRTVLGTQDHRERTVGDAIRNQAVGLNWAEGASVVVVKSLQKDASSLAEAIDAGSALDKAVDLLIVIDLTGKGHSILGRCLDKEMDTILAQR